MARDGATWCGNIGPAVTSQAMTKLQVTCTFAIFFSILNNTNNETEFYNTDLNMESSGLGFQVSIDK